MNTTKLKDLAEIIALVAVVGSLVVVAIELRQTQGALQAQAYQARAFNGIEANMSLAQDEELDRLSDLMTSADFDPATLSVIEFRKIRALLTISRIDLDNEHYQYQKGFLDAGFYHGETVERIRVEAPIWRSMHLPEPRPDFHKEVNRILAE